MRLLLVGVLVVACSAESSQSPPGGAAGEAAGGAAGQSTGGTAGELGTGGEGAVWNPPFECWEGCTPLSAFAVGSPPCQGLDQNACGSFGGAWVYAVPECGKSQLWVDACEWMGTWCAAKGMHERFQTCVQ